MLIHDCSLHLEASDTLTSWGFEIPTATACLLLVDERVDTSLSHVVLFCPAKTMAVHTAMLECSSCDYLLADIVINRFTDA